MTGFPPPWAPTRSSALQALDDFVPRAGRDYAATRNEDRGPENQTNVSRLSPWIRLRLLTEPEIVSAVLARHAYADAEKFIQEICWRTYWKGWLEARPCIWTAYLTDVRRAREEMDQAKNYRAAVEGRTGIDCFDAFARELVETGYLHNHARMWFASLWIFTLKLPWVLGADFFLRHLLDGDPASNTLSWRWVAGLQTQGKHYVATAANIRHYTGGRFEVLAPLVENPTPLQEETPFPTPVPLAERRQTLSEGPVGLLVGEDDLSAPDWLGQQHPCEAMALALPVSAYRSEQVEMRVVEFRREAMAHAAEHARKQFSGGVSTLDEADEVAAVVLWARTHRLRTVIMAEPPVGLWDHIKTSMVAGLGEAGIAVVYFRHPWDEAFYPHATKGFFHLKKVIPSVILKGISGSAALPLPPDRQSCGGRLANRQDS